MKRMRTFFSLIWENITLMRLLDLLHPALCTREIHLILVAIIQILRNDLIIESHHINTFIPLQIYSK